MNAVGIQNLILLTHPSLKKYIETIDVIPELESRKVCVVEAITDITIGQMLSRSAAKTIILRAKKLAKSKNVTFVADLNHSDLVGCGISNRKSKTISAFYDHYKKNRSEVENWRNIKPEKLFSEVNKHWGLSNWSASMLSIFYFGMENVFPYEDGSIKRVTRALCNIGIEVQPDHVSPYQSYLALYLWAILDKKLLEKVPPSC